MLRGLKAAFPEAEAHWWLSPELFPILKEDPDIHSLHPFDRRAWRKPSGWGHLTKTVRNLRERQFDLVLDLQSLARSALLSRLCRGQLTVGLEDYREGAPSMYDLRIARGSYETHAVDWYLSSLDALGVSQPSLEGWLPVNEPAAARMRSMLAGHGASFVALQPGARWKNKRWPVEKFVELVQKQSDVSFIMVGSPDEANLAEPICKAAPDRVISLVGKTTLQEAIESIRMADLLVTNDTGPMHIATAVGTRVVALFGPTNPSRTGPYQQLDKVVQTPLDCVPCMKSKCRNDLEIECLKTISATQVIERFSH